MDGQFLIRQIYDDEITYNLIGAAVEILSKSLLNNEFSLRQFGFSMNFQCNLMCQVEEEGKVNHFGTVRMYSPR